VQIKGSGRLPWRQGGSNSRPPSRSIEVHAGRLFYGPEDHLSPSPIRRPLHGASFRWPASGGVHGGFPHTIPLVRLGRRHYWRAILWSPFVATKLDSGSVKALRGRVTEMPPHQGCPPTAAPDGCPDSGCLARHHWLPLGLVVGAGLTLKERAATRRQRGHSRGTRSDAKRVRAVSERHPTSCTTSEGDRARCGGCCSSLRALLRGCWRRCWLLPLVVLARCDARVLLGVVRSHRERAREPVAHMRAQLLHSLSVEQPRAAELPTPMRRFKKSDRSPRSSFALRALGAIRHGATVADRGARPEGVDHARVVHSLVGRKGKRG
jgi:hypothetical protein